MTEVVAKKRRKRNVNGRGALVIVGALLVASALLRVGGSAGSAIASAAEDAATKEAAPTESMSLATSQRSEDLEAVLKAFKERENRIVEQEAAIANRMQALRVAEEEIEKKLQALLSAEMELRDTIAFAETASENDLAKLTKVYESMKPKDAAALFEEMTPEFAAGFLGRMRPEAAAAIMAGLTPEAAHTFSVVLAGRNANVPSE